MGCGICEYSYVDCECTHDMQAAYDRGIEAGKAIQADEIARLTAAMETCQKYRNAYAECDRIATEALRKAEAERDTARAETAMAFEVAEKALEARKYDDPDERGEYAFNAGLDKGIVAIRLITPAHATGALAARDREMRIAGYRIAQAEAARLGTHIVAPEHCAALTTPENGG